jgi:diguanylate cyclase (GGDEF)-like protein
MNIFRKLSSLILIDLGDLEGDYRVANLPSDRLQSLLTMTVAGAGIFAMLGLDKLLMGENSDLLRLMLVLRGGYALCTALVILLIARLNKVRVFDRIVFWWTLGTIACLLLFNYLRPGSFLGSAFDVIVLFALYSFSPLNFRSAVLLAALFSIGTLHIGYFVKTGVEPFVLATSASSQIVSHILGMGLGLQLHSYRRRSFKAYMEEKDAREMVAYLANIDPLTKSLTRRHFFNIAESEFKRFVRYHRPLSVLVIDADGFKKINDTHGHHAGDIVLRSLSLVAMEQKRAQDTFGRLGGEEFSLILPETTLEQARVVAERIRKVWEESPSNLDGNLIHSTVSIGAAEAQMDDESFDTVLRRADLMMYKAKEQGRNRVMTE